MVSVAASEFQKNFGEWHDKAFEGPVEITKYGRSSAFLVSAPMFRAMWASFRHSMPAAELSADEVDRILQAEVSTDQPYTLDDIADVEAAPHQPGL